MKINLSEMITISHFSSSTGSGIVKKMIHAPTLKIFAVKEEPISNIERK